MTNIRGFDDLRYAEDVILDTYGDTVSVDTKLKTLLKFGAGKVTTNGNTIMSGIADSGSGSVVAFNETYVEYNAIDKISSSSGSDTGVVVVEGHSAGSDVSVSSITQTAGTATVTTSGSHGLSVDEWVYIRGANEGGYNGIVQVATVPTGSTFTYSVDSGTTSPATGTVIVNSYNKTFVAQSITLAGQTETALTTPIARATRIFVAEQNRVVDLVGSVFVYEDDTVSSGVPQTAANLHCMVVAGKNQSQKASTTLSSQDYWIVTSFRGSMLSKTSSLADVALQIRRPGGVFREVEDVTCSSSHNGVFEFKPFLIVPKNSDVRLVGISDTDAGGGRDVSGSIQGYLAIVQ